MNTEDNLRLTQTSKGTPMGELLRCYWHPIAARPNSTTSRPSRSGCSVKISCCTRIVREPRSVALHCPHRRADLSYGFVEECGLRCSYHGWAFDERGKLPFGPVRGHCCREHTFSLTRSAKPRTRSKNAAACCLLTSGHSRFLVAPTWEPSPGTTASCRLSSPT